MGSIDINDYYRIEGNNALIIAHDQHDISITGEGTINGRGKELALAIDSQKALRNDLRLLVMSATLDGGRVAEEGSHDALMGMRGVYARLFDMQAERYR